VYFPVVDAAPTRKPSPSGAPGAARGCETVLVCEDDATVRALATQFLSAAGYSVLSAENGVSALEVAARHPGPIHLLLTDVIMPLMNGRELAHQLGAQRPDLRTLYVSGYTSNVIAQHGVLDAGVEFLEKPYNSRALLHHVRSILDQAAVTG
jgi:CheY-like chemotaxis protein